LTETVRRDRAMRRIDEFLLFAELGVRRHVVREPVSVCGMSKRNWKMAGNWPLQNLGLGPENPENPSLET
jgi:hypothetical protein